MQYYAATAIISPGPSVCDNGRVLPMEGGNAIVLDTLLDDVLNESILTDAAEEAPGLLQADDTPIVCRPFRPNYARLNGNGIDSSPHYGGGELDGLPAALQTREKDRAQLQADRAAIRAQAPLRARDVADIRYEVQTLASSW